MSPDEALIDACDEGDEKKALAALAAGADVKFRGRGGLTAFHCAARGGHRKIAERLLKKGAQLGTQRDSGATALFELVENNNNLSDVTWLLDLGVPVDVADNDGWTPLMVACCWDERWVPVVELLLKRGADINHVAHDDWTPLMLAMQSRLKFSPEVLLDTILLQSKGLDVNRITPRYGWTPLMHAAAGSNLEAVKALLERGADVHARMKVAPGKPFTAKASLHAKERSAAIKTKPEHDGFTALHWAVLKKRRSQKLLLQAGADPDAKSTDGRTPRTMGLPPDAVAKPKAGTGEAALLAAIAQNPTDDAPRLVYADWLLEQGNGWGEAIQLGVKLARLPEDSPERATLGKQLARLEKQHAAQFLGPLAKVVRRARYERGMLSLVVADAQLFAPSAEAIVARAPRATLQLTGLKAKGLEALTKASLGVFPTVVLNENRIDDDALERLVASPVFKGVKTLRLTGNVFTDRGMKALASSPHLGSLTELEVIDMSVREYMTAETLRAVVSSPKLSKLKVLYLSCAGAWSHVLSSCTVPLTELYLYRITQFDDSDAFALAKLSALKTLKVLKIDARKRFSDAAEKALLSSPHFKLERLELT